MNIDLGSSVIDIAVALAFVFFLLSLVASSVRELCAGFFALRSKTLVKGVEGMLGDAEVASEVLGHPLVRSELHKKKGVLSKGERGPSYVSPRNFAIALKQILEKKVLKERDEIEADPSKAQTDPVKAAERDLLLKQVDALSSQWLPGQAPPIASLEKWFDDSMERVSGWYKRTSQWWMVGIAVVLAVGLNASTVRIVETFEAEPAVLTAVDKQAETAVGNKEFKEKVEAENGQPADATEQIERAGRDASKALGNVNGLKLPLFWASEYAPHNLSEWGLDLAGWALTAIAISLGAPFWFDALGKLANLRMAGKNPEEKEKGKG